MRKIAGFMMLIAVLAMCGSGVVWAKKDKTDKTNQTNQMAGVSAGTSSSMSKALANPAFIKLTQGTPEEKQQKMTAFGRLAAALAKQKTAVE